MDENDDQSGRSPEQARIEPGQEESQNTGSDNDKDTINPMRWSPTFKWILVGLCSSIELTTNCAVLIAAPAVPQILDQLHAVNYNQESTLIITIWNLGGILGMFVIGPLSEMYGRRPVYNICNVLFCVCALVSGFSRNIPMLLAFRFLNGIGIASQALNLSIVGDIFETEQRGRAQAWIGSAPLIGPALGPILDGYLAQTIGWRWIFWLIAIVVPVQSIAFALLYRETYLPVLKPAAVEKGQTKERHTLLTVVRRPVQVFVMPVFSIPASCLSLVYGYLYVDITTQAEAFQDVYVFPPGASGLTFIGITVGMAIGTSLSGYTLDRYVVMMKARHNGKMKAEWRLPLVLAGGIAVTIGLFLYGWTLEKRVQFMAPIVGTGFIGFSLSATAIPIMTYFGDIFGIIEPLPCRR